MKNKQSVTLPSALRCGGSSPRTRSSRRGVLRMRRLAALSSAAQRCYFSSARSSSVQRARSCASSAISRLRCASRSPPSRLCAPPMPESCGSCRAAGRTWRHQAAVRRPAGAHIHPPAHPRPPRATRPRGSRSRVRGCKRSRRRWRARRRRRRRCASSWRRRGSKGRRRWRKARPSRRGRRRPPCRRSCRRSLSRRARYSPCQ